MPSPVAAPLARLQRLLPWSNTPRAWVERLSLVGVAAVAGVLIAYAGALDLWQLVLAWAVLLLVAAVLFRRGWLKLFGPMLWYDLVRTGRRVRTYLIRGAYLFILLAVLWMLYLNAWPAGYRGAPLNSQIARFAENFLYTFLITQYVLMVLLTPAYTAGAIAEERQKKTIQFILATDLRNHEIILGKLGSRMAHLGLLLLAGLPVLSAVQFLGGVDPTLILAGFAGTAVTLASTAGVGILASVVARPSRAALLLAYGAVLAYVLVCCLGLFILSWLPRQPFYAGAAAGPFSIESLIGVIEAGNPVTAVENAFNSANPFETALLQSLGAYALFHGIVATATTLAASMLVRRASLREPRPPGAKAAARRPSVGEQPMVWKELHAERGPGRRWPVFVLIGLLVGASMLPMVWGWYEQLQWHRSWAYWRESLNMWVRIVGTITACLTLLGVAVQAAYSIRTERDRETFDSLLTSPLSSEDILYGKWLGASLSVRWMLVWLALVWGLGVVGGGLNLLAVPLLVLAWGVYAAAMASLGLWFSLVSRTSMRAVLYTILAAVGLAVGHWLIWLPCGCLMFARGFPAEAGRWLLMAQGGLTPPAVLGGYFCFGYDERIPPDLFGQFIAFGLCGLVVWGVFAWMVWQATNNRFKRDGGRADVGAIRYRKPRRRLS